MLWAKTPTALSYVIELVKLKADSQSDARPCVTLIRETHKFITKKVGVLDDVRTQSRGMQRWDLSLS